MCSCGHLAYNPNFVLQLDAVSIENSLPYVFDQLLDISRGGGITIDDEIGVLFRNLGTTDSIAL